MNTQVETKGNKQVVESLRQEAQRNRVFNSVCHIFAMRERARQQVTINSLSITMKKEGFDFTKDQYKEVLQFMASLGLGKLDYDLKGRLRALKGIKVTLQSIGMAAISRKDDLDRYSLSPMFSNLPVPKDVPPAAEAVAKAQSIKKQAEDDSTKAKRQERSYPASLVVSFETDQQTFTIPGGLTSQQLGKILGELFSSKKV